MKELELVALTSDVPEYSLQAGDIGTVVHVHGNGEAAEVEFARAGGKTVAVLTLEKSDFRPFESPDILQARPLRN